jgi:tetratricopeptide (TPR) repeat protein
VVAGDFDLLNKVRISFKVYGFYFKKLFVPWPLNFGIIEISDWYVLAGILLAFLLLYLAWRFDAVGALGLMAFCSLSPAILVVFGKMTWTPIAERYLYTSVALFAPITAYIIHRLKMSSPVSARCRLYAPVVLLLLVFFGTTLHRSWVWQDNLRLYRDTVTKSPDMVAAQNELASALMRRGLLTEAEEVLAGMQTENDGSDFISDDINLANIKFSNGDLDGAREFLLPLLDLKHKQHHDLLQALLRINDQRIGRAKTLDLRLAIQRESLTWLNEQQSMQPNAFTLYRIAKMQLSMGNTVESLATFRSVLATAPADAYYRGAVETSITMLERL